MLFGVMMAVSQIFQMTFEFQFVHGKAPHPVPGWTLLFFNPA